MPRVTIELPSALSVVVGDDLRFELEAGTLEETLERLVERHPTLRGSLFDETGGFREHVLCYHNKTSTRWLESLATPVADGDVVRILQAVSGG